VSIDSSVALDAVSCPKVIFCAAVDVDGNALTYNGTAWTSPVSVDSGSTLTSVSCATTLFCAAVDDHGNALTYDGTAWTSPVAIDAGHALDSVRCATTTFCAAVDDNGNALTFDGTAWTSPDSIDFTRALEAVSCPTTYFCVAVDGVGDALTFPAPMAITTISLPAGTVHDTYSDTLAASGGNPPYKWLAKLPPGLAVNQTTGVISGTPRSSGHFVVAVTLFDQKIRVTGRPATQHRAVARLVLTIS
jgi:putative Ig domain-containing protein